MIKPARQCLLITVLVIVSGHASADKMGRLFTTPGERLTLDTLRYARTEPQPESPVMSQNIKDEMSNDTELFDKNINFKGFVSKQNGDSTAWLNESNTLKGDLGLGNLQIKSLNKQTGQIIVVIPGNDTVVPLKVGESYDPQSN